MTTREACRPPVFPRLSLLTRLELERLAARFYGRCPDRFEELLLQMWAERERTVNAIPSPLEKEAS